ncbi:T9SS type A sorting domain-containing protein [Mangrovibacterium lignilyticum]|uniref:T9SS type A sorting domain-containing protein n=1 Tax=Mangrovibacterium lignilyticum TaxID=2668052 RepID=UPI0013D2DA26|nr:T9SS type A sorting domain-containing protein [Mangrovibacterium lignilyticum]
MKKFYFLPSDKGEYRCWQLLFVLPFFIVGLLATSPTMGQGNKADITGNILGIAPVQAPHHGTAIDGNAYAYWRDTTIWVVNPYSPTDSVEQNFGEAGDIFYWPEAYPPPPGFTADYDTAAGVLDIINNFPVIHDFPDVDNDITVVYNDGVGNEDLSIFRTGAKINDDPNTYYVVAGKPPGKNEIQNAGAIFTWGDENLVGIDGENGNPDDLWCAFAADRKETNGSSYIDFEFLQAALVMDETGHFTSYAPAETGGRTPNDILLTVEYTNGGPVANVIVQRWEPIEGSDPVEYEYHMIGPETAMGAGDGYPYGSILATVNTEITPVHYLAFGQTMDFNIGGEIMTLPYYDVNQWCEGAVNVSALFGLSGDDCLTVSTVFIRTRTSGSSGQSQLKDLPGPPIQLNITADPPEIACGDVLLEECTSDEDIAIAYEAWKNGDYIDIIDPGKEGGASGFVPNGTFDELPANPHCGFSTSYQFVYQDRCLHTDTVTCTFEVTGDTTDPVITCSDDQTFECEVGTVNGPSSVTDNCDASPIVTGPVVTGSLDDCGLGTLTYTWTATDDCGNSSTCSKLVTVVDTTPPVITCSDDQRFECEVGTVNGPLSVTDNCDEDPMVTGPVVTGSLDDCGLGTLTYTWTATDCAGNSSTCSKLVTVYDTTPPVIVCSGDQSFECEVGTVNGPSSVSDNCDDDPEVTGPVVTGSLDDCGLGTLTYTWTATDCAGNSSTCSKSVSVYDTTPPVIVCSGDQSFECEVGTVDGPSSVTDNCDDDPMVTGPVVTGSLDDCGLGTLTYTWTATDCAGNSSTCSKSVSVYDTTPPVIVCSGDQSFECEVGTVDGPSSVTDNCDDDPMVTGPVVTGSLDDCGLGTLTYTWTATDCAGNSSTCSKSVSVYDTTPPVIVCSGDQRFECEVGTVDGPSSVTDNCDDDPMVTGPVVTGSLDDCGLGTLTYTWTATDCAGNSSTCSKSVSVYDTTPPVIVCSGDQSFECEVGTVDGPSSVTDNCDDDPMVTGPVVTGSLDDCGLGTLTYTWTATDCAGNSSTCSKSVSVYDTTPPVIVCSGDQSFECEVGTVNGPSSVTDNCDDDPMVTGPVVTGSLNDCGLGTLTYTWTATDCAGNSSTCSKSVSVYDTTPPVIVCSGDQSFECEVGTVNGPSSVTDNCDDDPMVTGPVVTGSLDDCGLGTLTYTWTATDCAGNSSTCSKLVTVYDTTPPVITCPADVYAVCEDIVDTGEATATDNCDPNPDIGYTDVTVTDMYGWTTTRTWTATDCAGNSASCEQIISYTCHPTCNTAYARSDDNACFYDYGFSNWGWSNSLAEGDDEYWPIYAGNPDCAPITDPIGSAHVTYSGSTVTVVYMLDAPYYLEQVHVDVGCDMFPMKNGSYTVSPGQYNFGDGNLDMATMYTVQFTDVSGPVWVIVHAVSCKIEGYTPVALSDNGAYSESIVCASPVEVFSAESGSTLSLKSATVVTAYPNPFSDQITFEFTADQDGLARLELFNMFGQKVAVVLKQQVTEGQYVKTQYIPDGVVSGAYIYRFMLGDTVINGQIIFDE